MTRKQCRSIKKDGNQCTRTILSGSYCWQHSDSKKLTIGSILILGFSIVLNIGGFRSDVIQPLIEANKPYGQSEDNPSYMYGPVVKSSVKDSMKFFFAGNVLDAKENKICLKKANSEECYFEASIEKKGWFGQKRINISAMFYSTDGKPTGRIEGNRFTANQDDYYSFRYDDYAIEIVENLNLDVALQVIYEPEKNICLINGYFFDGEVWKPSVHREDSYVGDYKIFQEKSYMYISESSSLDAIKSFPGSRIERLFKYDNPKPYGKRARNIDFGNRAKSDIGNTIFLYSDSVFEDKKNLDIFIDRIEKHFSLFLKDSMKVLERRNISIPKNNLLSSLYNEAKIVSQKRFNHLVYADKTENNTPILIILSLNKFLFVDGSSREIFQENFFRNLMPYSPNDLEMLRTMADTYSNAIDTAKLEGKIINGKLEPIPKVIGILPINERW